MWKGPLWRFITKLKGLDINLWPHTRLLCVFYRLHPHSRVFFPLTQKRPGRFLSFMSKRHSLPSDFTVCFYTFWRFKLGVKDSLVSLFSWATHKRSSESWMCSLKQFWLCYTGCDAVGGWCHINQRHWYAQSEKTLESMWLCLSLWGLRHDDSNHLTTIILHKGVTGPK